YLGERSFPLIMQNVHRYFLYLALIFIVILSIDVWKALWFTDSAGKTSLGVGIGTIVLVINVVLLGGYTFGCHSLRHLIGGFRDQLSGAPACYQAYRCVSCFNRRHMLWAWTSLFWVGFSALYVRLCSMGIWHDFRLIYALTHFLPSLRIRKARTTNRIPQRTAYAPTLHIKTKAPPAG